MSQSPGESIIAVHTLFAPTQGEVTSPLCQKRGQKVKWFWWMAKCLWAEPYAQSLFILRVASTPSSCWLIKYSSSIHPYEIYSRQRACTWIFDLLVSFFYSTAFPPVVATPLCTGISKTSALFCGVKVAFQPCYRLILHRGRSHSSSAQDNF